MHGTQWSVIAPQFPGRRLQEVAVHWQSLEILSLKKGPFTAEEDAAISDHVSVHGPHNWGRLAELLPRRTAKQVRERWQNQLAPNVQKAPWSIEEDMYIYQQWKAVGPRWSEMSKALPGRTDNSIKNRFNASISRRIKVTFGGTEYLLPDGFRVPLLGPKRRSQKTPHEPIAQELFAIDPEPIPNWPGDDFGLAAQRESPRPPTPPQRTWEIDFPTATADDLLFWAR
jgi:hypothetical protein